MRKQNIKYIPFAKYISTSKEEKKPDRFLDDVIKVIGAISGASIIFAALLYIFGKHYAEGYFGAMNVPEYILKFSIGEYGAVAWFPIIFLFVVLTITSICFPLIDIIVLPILNKVISIFIKPDHSKNNKTKEFVREKINSISYLLYVIIIVLCCYLLYQALVITTNLGTSAGKNYLLNSASIMELKIAESTTEEGQTSRQNGENPHYYINSGFRLITKNDGKYYLFKELDPETCKPKQVYIIDESSIDQVILSPAEDISDQCNN